MELPPVLFEESCVFILFIYFTIFANSRRRTHQHDGHRFHCYVDHNNGFAAVVTTLHEAKHWDTTTIFPTSALPLPFMRYVKNIPNEVTSRYI